VIDDGSKDKTCEIIEKIKDERIRVLKQKTNKGLAHSLNLGVRESKSNIIAILEHDDIWIENKLEKQLKYIDNGSKISTCRAIVWNTDNKKFTKINNGNLSCVVFTKEISSLIFPIPEENKRYLGIEDGIIAARLEIAKDKNLIEVKDISHTSEILTIMTSSNKTLSSLKNSFVMENRYRNIIDLFANISGQYDGLDKLLLFWKKH
jgi:glycosyltransferase involved in cell wall biosynthesis